MFDPEAAVSADRAVDRLFLRQARAQCLGSERDDFLIDQICAILSQDLKKSAVVQRRQVLNRLRDGEAASSSKALSRISNSSVLDVGNAGRSNWVKVLEEGERLLEVDPTTIGLDRQDWASYHNPKELSGRTLDAVRGQLHGHMLGPPPVFVGDKKSANSTVAARMKRWLDSEDGRWWQQQRASLLGDGGRADEYQE